MQRIWGVVTDGTKAVPNAQVSIYIAGTTTLATLYNPNEGDTPTHTIGNPLVADGSGRWICAIPDGAYTVVWTPGTGPEFRIPYWHVVEEAGGGGGGGGVAISGGASSQSSGTVEFANSNGISFGLNAGTMTASHNGLTTAMASNASTAFAGTGFTTTNAPGATVLGTHDSAGLKLGVPAFLTTAQPPGAYLTTARASNDAVGLNTALTAGPLAWTVNSAGLSLNAGSAAGTTTGFGGNLISGSMTHNTAGLNLSLNHPAWLTTAANSTHSHGNPTLNLTNLAGTTASASNGFTLSLSATAQSNQTMGLYGVSNTTGASSSSTFDARSLSFQGAGIASVGMSNGSVVVSVPAGGGGGDGYNILAGGGVTAPLSATVNFRDTGGVSWSLITTGGSTEMRASVKTDYLTTAQPVGAYLTTARASNDAIGLNSALTANGVSMTANSSGLSLNFPAFLTTAANSTHSHGNPTLNLTNLSGTTASNSAGFTLSLSAAAGGGAGDGWNEAQFTNSTANSTMPILWAGNSNGSGNVTMGLTGSTVTMSAAGGAPAITKSYAVIQAEFSNDIHWAASTNWAMGQNALYFMPFQLDDYLSAMVGRLPVSLQMASSAASSGQRGVTLGLAFYSQHSTNDQKLTIHYSTEHTIAGSYSSNVSMAYSCITNVGNSTSYGSTTFSSAGTAISLSGGGGRELLFPISQLLSSGSWWLALRYSTSGSGTAGNLPLVNLAGRSHQTYAPMHNALNASLTNQWHKMVGLGSFSATTAAFPGSVNFSQINAAGVSPILMFASNTN